MVVVRVSRPWSAHEIEERIPELIDQIDEAVTGLRELGIAAAETRWAYKRSRAIAYLNNYADAEGKKFTAGEREALADEETAHVGLAADLAENAYRDQRSRISGLQTEAELARTLMVSARDAAK